MYRVHCLIGCCFLTTALANLSLDQAGAIWQYTTSSLAGTTSAKCKGAYAEEVTCSRQLLQLTGRPSPENRPSAEDLSAICTSDCEESLEDYISAVEQQCKLPGDAAEETTDAPSGQSPADHVWIAGNMLKYTWTQACAKDRYGTTLVFCSWSRLLADPDLSVAMVNTAISRKDTPTSPTPTPTSIARIHVPFNTTNTGMSSDRRRPTISHGPNSSSNPVRYSIVGTTRIGE